MARTPKSGGTQFISPLYCGCQALTVWHFPAALSKARSACPIREEDQPGDMSPPKKSETRNKFKIRNSKRKCRMDLSAFLNFMLLDLFRISCFGFRVFRQYNVAFCFRPVQHHDACHAHSFCARRRRSARRRGAVAVGVRRVEEAGGAANGARKTRADTAGYCPGA